MGPADLDRFRRLLVAHRDALAQAGDVRLDPLRDDAVGKLDEDFAPLAEMGQVIASRRNSARTGSRKQIDEALGRLDDDPDAFGLCDACDEPIPRGRLELMPWVTKCVACQGASEDPRGGGRKHITDYR